MQFEYNNSPAVSAAFDLTTRLTDLWHTGYTHFNTIYRLLPLIINNWATCLHPVSDTDKLNDGPFGQSIVGACIHLKELSCQRNPRAWIPNNGTNHNICQFKDVPSGTRITATRLNTPVDFQFKIVCRVQTPFRTSGRQIEQDSVILTWMTTNDAPSSWIVYMNLIRAPCNVSMIQLLKFETDGFRMTWWPKQTHSYLTSGPT
jgi:hypothetical protein